MENNQQPVGSTTPPTVLCGSASSHSAPRPPRYSSRWLLPVILSSLGLIALVVGGGWLYGTIQSRQQAAAPTAASFPQATPDTTTLPLVGDLQGSPIRTVTVNGDLTVGSTLTLTPGTLPASSASSSSSSSSSSATTPRRGSLFYDATTNQPYYFDGSAYQPLGSSGSVRSLGGATGAIALGSGLSLQGGILTSSSLTTLPQDLTTTATPTFNGLNLTTALSVSSGGTGATSASAARTNLGSAQSGTNSDITSLSALTTITPSSSLTIDSTTQPLILQGSSTTVLTATNGAYTTTLGFTSPLANTILNLPASSAGTYTICTTIGNCAGRGGGVTTLGGASDTIAAFSSSNSIVKSLLSQNTTTHTMTIADSGIFQGVSGSASLTLG